MKKFVLLSFLFVLSLQANENRLQKLNQAALLIEDPSVVYDGSYRAIGYPMGDVSKKIGVCTDVIVRAYRKLGIDLQVLVHQDMKKNFQLYPQKWGHKRADKNIDHRRVPNLQIFFKRFGKELKITQNPSDYKPGHIVTWYLGPNNTIPHIGIVTNKKSLVGKNPLVMHNYGGGQVLEDILFSDPITGHYTY